METITAIGVHLILIVLCGLAWQVFKLQTSINQTHTYLRGLSTELYRVAMVVWNMDQRTNPNIPKQLEGPKRNKESV